MTEEYRAKLPELKGKENFAEWYKLTVRRQASGGFIK